MNWIGYAIFGGDWKQQGLSIEEMSGATNGGSSAEIAFWELNVEAIQNREFVPQFAIEMGRNYAFFIDFASVFGVGKNRIRGMGWEVDGKHHQEQREYDKRRDARIRQKGINIVRFKAYRYNGWRFRRLPNGKAIDSMLSLRK